MQLTEKEKERYNRQIQLDEIGEKGQTLLRQAKVLIVGVGDAGNGAEHVPVLHIGQEQGVGAQVQSGHHLAG